MEGLKYDYDEIKDILSVEGISYSGQMFRQLGGALEIGVCVQVVERRDGVIVLQNVPQPEAQEPAIESSPELRSWAIEQAVKSGSTNDGWNNVERVAQSYVDYVLKGEA